MTLTVTNITRVSTSEAGDGANFFSTFPDFSPDGSSIVFLTDANNLGPTDTNDTADIYIKNLSSGAVQRVTLDPAGLEADAHSDLPFYTPDGTHILFASAAENLVANDDNNNWDIFIKDIVSGNVILVSEALDGTQPDLFTSMPSISADGTKVAFESFATNLVPGLGPETRSRIFIKDLNSGVISVGSSNENGDVGNEYSYAPQFSPVDNKILFSSSANNLVSTDTNNIEDIFIKDLDTGEVTLVSTTQAAVQGNNHSFRPVWSPDGTKVAFLSDATNFSATNPPFISESIFVKDLTTGELKRIEPLSGAAPSSYSGDPVFSPDGTRLAFVSRASNFVSGDSNSVQDIFVADLITGAVSRVSTTLAGGSANGYSESPVWSPDGTKLAFSSEASNLVSGDTNGVRDIYVVTLEENSGISGTGGNDTVNGRDTAETISTGSGDDRITANGGNDVVIAGSGNDVVFGGEGNDDVSGNSGDDRLFGNEGNDILSGGTDNDSLFGDTGDDTLSGGDGDDFLFGNDGTDNIKGGDGDDYIEGGNGDDVISGNDDSDQIFGNAGRDYVHGGNGNDVIYGNGSSDDLYGDAGNDVIYGGTGTNSMKGGTGADGFVLTSDIFDAHPDKIGDFNISEDDYLFLENILEGYDAVTSAISDFVNGTEVSGSTVISIDRDGTGTTYAFEDAVVLKNLTGLDLEDMRDNGNIVIS